MIRNLVLFLLMCACGPPRLAALAPGLRPPRWLEPIAKKLRFAVGHKVVVLNAPDGYLEMLQPGPRGIATELKPSQTYDACSSLCEPPTS